MQQTHRCLYEQGQKMISLSTSHVSELQQLSYSFRDELLTTHPQLSLPSKAKWLSEIARSLGFKDWGTLKHQSHDKSDIAVEKPLNSNSINLVASHICAVLQHEIELDVIKGMLKELSETSSKNKMFAATSAIVNILRKSGRAPKVKIHDVPSEDDTIYVSDRLKLEVHQPTEHVASVQFLDITCGDKYPVHGKALLGQIEEVINKVSNCILYQETALVFYDQKTNRLGKLEIFDFDWSSRIGVEPFYVNGHLSENELLDAVRLWTGNRLDDWEQRHVIIHQLWEDHNDPWPVQNDDISPMCLCSLKLQTPDANKLKLYPSITSFPATVICHKLLPPIEELESTDITDNLWCNRYESWFKGFSKKIQPYELLYDALLGGFTLLGKQLNHTVETMLEWPTDNFELALDNVEKWKKQSASDLNLINGGMSISVEKLDALTVARIRRYMAIVDDSACCFTSLFLENWDDDF